MAVKLYMSDGSMLNISELSGKMESFYSLSTSVWSNPYCQARSYITDTICQKCYSRRVSYRKAFVNALENNSVILESKLYEYTDFPYIPFSVFRLESHGDLRNVTHARNYIRLARRNPHCTFALWTKNHGFMDKAIELEGKPDNLIIGQSSEYLNREISKTYWWTDFTFTVFTPGYAEAHEIKINCPKKCKDCMRCYTKSSFEGQDEPFKINELLK